MQWVTGDRPCRQRTWGEFKVHLASLIRVISKRPDHFIILAANKPKRFVQFDSSHSGKGVRGEAVSNHFLERGERLDSTTQRAMRELGWRRPGRAESLWPNYWKVWDSPVPANDLALLASRTLSKVFKIEKPTKLTITCNKFVDESLESANDLPKESLINTLINTVGSKQVGHSARPPRGQSDRGVPHAQYLRKRALCQRNP